jgi:adenosylmethionine-8-amino-7-oxononanoate aminotransferase
MKNLPMPSKLARLSCSYSGLGFLAGGAAAAEATIRVLAINATTLTSKENQQLLTAELSYHGSIWSNGK